MQGLRASWLLFWLTRQKAVMFSDWPFRFCVARETYSQRDHLGWCLSLSVRLCVCPVVTSHFLGTRHTSLYLVGDTFIIWNVTILEVVSARYAKGWIQGGAKVGRRGVPPLTKSSFRPNGYGKILMNCWPTHTFIGILSFLLSYFGLNCLLMVLRWAI